MDSANESFLFRVKVLRGSWGVVFGGFDVGGLLQARQHHGEGRVQMRAARFLSFPLCQVRIRSGEREPATPVTLVTIRAIRDGFALDAYQPTYAVSAMWAYMLNSGHGSSSMTYTCLKWPKCRSRVEWCYSAPLSAWNPLSNGAVFLVPEVVASRASAHVQVRAVQGEGGARTWYGGSRAKWRESYDACL
ncbi:hypothetical protein GCM10027162_45700 [Streptomyces incanus]